MDFQVGPHPEAKSQANDLASMSGQLFPPTHSCSHPFPIATARSLVQEMIIFLQNLPTQSWTDHDVELLLSEAYVLKTVWQGAENHFANLANGNGQGQGFGMLGR